MGTTYMCGVYDSEYVCKACGCSMPMNMGGEDASVHFNYCPFCGRKSKSGMAMKQVRNGLEVNRMTLLEFTNKLFAVGDNTTVYVCDDEPNEYGEEELRNHINNESALIMTHLSCMVLDYYCKPEICNAKVDRIYALGKDEYLVVIDMEDD